ncbi:hypothetical protein CC86DRAFT_258977, partial [Ophiobolus disseminans]
KPPLSRTQERERFQWALTYNPDKYKEYDNLGYNFKHVVFTDETLARIGEQRGIIRTWARPDEIFDDDVKKDRKP